MAKPVISKQGEITAQGTNASRDHMREVANTLKVTWSGDMPQMVHGTVVSHVERINERELTSIYALLAYVSYNQNVRQETVQMIVEAEFGVDHIAKLRRDDYMKAVEFLVDIRMDEIIN